MGTSAPSQASGRGRTVRLALLSLAVAVAVVLASTSLGFLSWQWQGGGRSCWGSLPARQLLNSSGLQQQLWGANLTAPPEGYGDYVAFCLVVKDEHSRVREWIAYHRGVGVGRFHIYDDGSQPPMQEVLQDFIDSGLVTYRYLASFIGKPGQMQQLAVYADCFKHYGSKHTWIGPLDVDEFVFVRDRSPDLPSVLRRYEDYGGLSVNWRLFGSSGHLGRPQGGVLENFIRCTRPTNAENGHVKVFVNTKYYAGVTWNPHQFDYTAGKFAVNTNLTPVDGAFSTPPQANILTINHYAVRSEIEFQNKMAKGSGLGPGPNAKNRVFWDRIEFASKVYCRYGVPYGIRVQAAGLAMQAELAAMAASAAAARSEQLAAEYVLKQQELEQEEKAKRQAQRSAEAGGAGGTVGAGEGSLWGKQQGPQGDQAAAAEGGAAEAAAGAAGGEGRGRRAGPQLESSGEQSPEGQASGSIQGEGVSRPSSPAQPESGNPVQGQGSAAQLAGQASLVQQEDGVSGEASPTEGGESKPDQQPER